MTTDLPSLFTLENVGLYLTDISLQSRSKEFKGNKEHPYQRKVKKGVQTG